MLCEIQEKIHVVSVGISASVVEGADRKRWSSKLIFAHFSSIHNKDQRAWHSDVPKLKFLGKKTNSSYYSPTRVSYDPINYNLQVNIYNLLVSAIIIVIIEGSSPW